MPAITLSYCIIETMGYTIDSLSGANLASLSNENIKTPQELQSLVFAIRTLLYDPMSYEFQEILIKWAGDKVHQLGIDPLCDPDSG